MTIPVKRITLTQRCASWKERSNSHTGRADDGEKGEPHRLSRAYKSSFRRATRSDPLVNAVWVCADRSIGRRFLRFRRTIVSRCRFAGGVTILPPSLSNLCSKALRRAKGPCRYKRERKKEEKKEENREARGEECREEKKRSVNEPTDHTSRCMGRGLACISLPSSPSSRITCRRIFAYRSRHLNLKRRCSGLFLALSCTSPLFSSKGRRKRPIRWSGTHVRTHEWSIVIPIFSYANRTEVHVSLPQRDLPWIDRAYLEEKLKFGPLVRVMRLLRDTIRS